MKQERIQGNGIYILPTQLFAPEIILTYERGFVTKRIHFSYSLGYKIPHGEKRLLEPFGAGLITIPMRINTFSMNFPVPFMPRLPLLIILEKKVDITFRQVFFRYYWIDNQRIILTILKHKYSMR